MFASYPKLGPPSPSSYIMWSKENATAVNGAVCHSKMPLLSLAYDNLVTAVPNNSEIALEYIRMLIRGPFRSMSDLIRLDRVGTNYYLHCLNIGIWPANVLMNFCIASRVPIEFKHFLEPWAKRCDAGYDPILAFLLTYSYGDSGPVFDYKYNTDGERTFSVQRPGHLWFDPASNWLNIMHGVIEKPSVSYRTRPYACLPTNIIWGHSGDYQKLKTMSDEEIAEFYETPIKIYEKPEPPAPKVNKIKLNNPYAFPNAEQMQAAVQAMHALQDVHNHHHLDLPEPGQWPNHWAQHQNPMLADQQPQPIEAVQDEPEDQNVDPNWDPDEFED